MATFCSSFQHYVYIWQLAQQQFVQGVRRSPLFKIDNCLFWAWPSRGAWIEGTFLGPLLVSEHGCK